MSANISSLIGYSVMRTRVTGLDIDRSTTVTLLRTGDPCTRDLEPTCPCADCYVSRLFSLEAELGFRPLVRIRFFFDQGEIKINRALPRSVLQPLSPVAGLGLPVCIARGIE